MSLQSIRHALTTRNHCFDIASQVAAPFCVSLLLHEFCLWPMFTDESFGWRLKRPDSQMVKRCCKKFSTDKGWLTAHLHLSGNGLCVAHVALLSRKLGT